MKPQKNYRQLRARVQRLRQRNRVAGVAGGFEVFGQQRYQQTKTAGAAAMLADHWAEQNPGETFHVWSPDQQHAYEVTAMLQRQTEPDLNTAGFDTDESVAVELFDWINNSETPHRQLDQVERNMARKMAQDRYDPELAIQGFMYAAESGAKDYAREFGGSWHQMFPKEIRRLAAQMLRDQFEEEVRISPESYEQHVFKKHLPRWRERYDRNAATRLASYQILWNTVPVSSPLERGDRHRDVHSTPESALEEIRYEFPDAEMVADGDYFYVYPSEEYIDPQDSNHENSIAEIAPQQILPDRLWASANRTQGSDKQESIMTQRPPSRRRRQRLANRVERARSRENLRNRNITRERHAEREEQQRDTKEQRLQRRVASLTRLLRTAERELRRAEREEARTAEPQRRTAPQRDRVAEIRERLERERRPIRQRRPATRPVPRRAARRPEPKRTAPRRPAPKRTAEPQQREAAPKVIRRKSDGKLYVRVD